MSGRNLDRYVAVLDAPREVQEALLRKEVTLIQAAKAGRLRPQERDVLTEAIRNGAVVKDVVAGLVAKKEHKCQVADYACAALLRNLKKDMDDLEGREESITTLAQEQIHLLERAIAFLHRLRDRTQARPAPETMTLTLQRSAGKRKARQLYRESLKAK